MMKPEKNSLLSAVMCDIMVKGGYCAGTESIDMADYIGSKCIVCGEHFKKGDDIVVCPDCGTPYHRDCYNKAGACTNTALHESGASWQPEPEQQIAAIKICPSCRTLNTASAEKCCQCGAPLGMNPIGVYAKVISEDKIESAPLRGNTPQEHNIYNSTPDDLSDRYFPGGKAFMVNYSDPLCGFNPGEEYENDVKLAELGAFVDSNTHYFLPRFKIMKETNRRISWNLLAMFFPDLFFANRKMPLMALICVLTKVTTSLPNIMNNLYNSKVTGGIVGELLSHFDIPGGAFQTLVVFTYIINMAFVIGMAFYANSIYYRHCLNNIPRIKASAQPNATLAELHKKGGTSGLWLALFILIEVAVYMVYYISLYTSMMT